MQDMNKYLVLAVALSASLSLFPSFGQQADAGAGRDVFEAKCWDCHNTDSNEKKVGPGLKGTKNGKLPSGKPATHDVILPIINKGGGDMPPFGALLNDQEKEDVIAYVLTL
jgi:cytochrome c